MRMRPDCQTSGDSDNDRNLCICEQMASDSIFSTVIGEFMYIVRQHHQTATAHHFHTLTSYFVLLKPIQTQSIKVYIFMDQ
jgi:hypothetical protein